MKALAHFEIFSIFEIISKISLKFNKKMKLFQAFFSDYNAMRLEINYKKKKQKKFEKDPYIMDYKINMHTVNASSYSWEPAEDGEKEELDDYSLIPSKYIEFVDRDLDIDYKKEMARIQEEMKVVMKAEKKSQQMLEKAFRGIGYEID